MAEYSVFFNPTCLKCSSCPRKVLNIDCARTHHSYPLHHLCRALQACRLGQETHPTVLRFEAHYYVVMIFSCSCQVPACQRGLNAVEKPQPRFPKQTCLVLVQMGDLLSVRSVLGLQYWQCSPCFLVDRAVREIVGSRAGGRAKGGQGIS